jgi:hypothetical protein
MRSGRTPLSSHHAQRLIGLQRAVTLCQRLDAAERDPRKADAALLIARHVLYRMLVGARSTSRGRPM